MSWGKVKFKKKFIKELEDYFNIEANRVVEEIIEGNNYTKTSYKEFHRDTFYQWLKDAEDENYKWEDKEDKKKLSDTYKIAKENQESIWLQNSLKWLYSPAFAIFLWKNVFWYKDKTETESTLNMQNITIEIVKNEDKNN